MNAPRVLVLSGGPHPFAETTPILAGILDGQGCAVTIVGDPDDAAAVLRGGGADLFVVNALRWRMLADRHAADRAAHAYAIPPSTAAALGDWITGGGRMLACHGAPICFDDWAGWGDLLGARWSWERSGHAPLGAVRLHIAVPDHPLVSGLGDTTITDECYGFLEHTTAITGLVTGTYAGSVHPLLWEHRPGDGHVVVCLLGHGPESFAHPTHVEILRRSTRHLLASRSPGPRTPTPPTREGR